MAFIASLIAGRGKATATQQTAAVGLQVQTSVLGRPIPLVYGMTRVAPNLIWYGDFKSVQQSSSVGGKGGMTGAGGKGGGSGTYVYSASFEMALCDNFTHGIWDVYIDKNITTLQGAGLSWFQGQQGQTPWSYLLSTSGQIDNEIHTVPGSGPFTVATNQTYLYDLGASVTTSVPFRYAPAPGGLAAGTYKYLVNTNNVPYSFAAADNGKTVVISYTLQGVPHSFTGTIVSGNVTINNIPGSLFRDAGVTTIVGSPLAKTTGAPASGQYTVSGGVYTFNAAQAGQKVFISYVPTSGNSKALGYSGISYIAAANYNLGNNPTLPNFNFEVGGAGSQSIPQEIQGEQYTLPSSGLLRVVVRFWQYFLSDGAVIDQDGNVYTPVGSSPGTHQYTVSGGVYTFGGGNAGATVYISYAASEGPDADPSFVVTDLLTNSVTGAGFPVARLADLSTYQAYCLASGLLISPLYDTQAQASSMLDDIAKATNSAFVWSDGALKLVPYGDQAITGNGASYSPPASPLYSLNDDDFLPNANASGSTDDPVILSRKRPADAFNSLKLEWLDRGNNYSPAIAEAKDQAALNSVGLRQDSVRSFHMFCNGNAARVSVQLQLQRETVRNIYQFTLDQRYVVLDPMDIVSISDSYLGLVNQWVRITEIAENDDESLSVTAEEYLQGTGTAPRYSYQQGLGYNADYNADPGDTNIPVMFEPTAELAEALEVWLAASGGPMWGGCEVWISQDGASYQKAGKITGPSRQGYLNQPLASVTMNQTGLTIDTANTIEADIALSGGQLLSASQEAAQTLATLCYLGSGNNYELLGYRDAGLVSQNLYDLTYLIRGAYGSAILSHAVGEQFARLDDSVFKYGYTQDRIGKSIYVKFPAFNIYGGGQQTLDDVVDYAFTLSGLAYGTPLPEVQNFRTSYVASITSLTWDEVADFRPVLYEIRKGGSWPSAQVLGRVAHPPFNVQGNGTYWISAYSQPNPGLEVYSEHPHSLTVSGAQIVSNVIASWDERTTGWSGTFGGSAALSGGQVVLTGVGNILGVADYLNTADIFDLGGIGNAGTYTVPDSHVISIGRVAPCSVIISSQSIGQHVGDNVLTIADYLNFQDLLDAAAQSVVNVYPNVALSQDGVTWGPWQKWAPGSYVAMAFKAQMALETTDPTVQAILQSFVFEVDVPDRDDHYTNLSLASGGTTVAFTPDGAGTPAPFNGGPQGSPAAPHIQVTIINAQAGDQVVISAVSLSGCTLQVKNGGVGVARAVNALVQGY